MAWEMHPKKLQNAFFSAELEIIKFMKKREKIAQCFDYGGMFAYFSGGR